MAVSRDGERRRGSAMRAAMATYAGIVWIAWIGVAAPRSASADEPMGQVPATAEPVDDAASDASADAANEDTVPAAKYTIADVAWMSGHWVYEQDGRLWIFEPGSEAHVEYLKTGKGPAEQLPSVGCSIKWKR